MNNFCKLHQVSLIEMVSKTKLDDEGQPKHYFAHRTKDGLCFGRDDGEEADGLPITPEPESSAEQDQETLGKIRHGLVCAFVEKNGLVPLTGGDKAIISQLVDFISTGK